MKIARTVKLTAATTGALVGSFAVASAIDATQTPASQLGVDQLNEGPPPPAQIFAPTSGEEARAFPYSVDSVESNGIVDVVKADGDGVCLKIEIDSDAVADGCFDATTVASGLAYQIFGTGSDGFVIVGAVPDGVDTVLVGGNDVAVKDGIWTTQVESNAPATLVVGDSQKDVWVTLRGADPDR